MDIFLAIEVNSAYGAAARIKLDLVNVAVGANLAATGFFRNGNHGREGTGFCFDFAAEAEAKTAIDASAAAPTRLRKNSHRRWKGIETEFPRGAFEKNSVRLYRQRRHGIGLGTRRIKGTRGGEA